MALTTTAAGAFTVDSLTPLAQWALAGFTGPAPDGVARTLAALAIVATHAVAKVVYAWLASRGVDVQPQPPVPAPQP